jgi:hypothetical protein
MFVQLALIERVPLILVEVVAIELVLVAVGLL